MNHRLIDEEVPVGEVEDSGLPRILLAVRVATGGDPSLRWENVTAGSPPVIVLAAHDAKTGAGRGNPPVVGALSGVLKARKAAGMPGCDRIFHSGGESMVRPNGGLLDRFYGQWARACKAASLPSTTRVYDLRRSAIRNLIAAGVGESTVMKISGHLSSSTFRRYLIVGTDEIARALALLQPTKSS